MVTTQDYALLSLYVYDVSRPNINRPLLPTGWTLAEPLHSDDLLGFSYGVFRGSGSGSGKWQRGQVLPFALMTIDTFHWAPPYCARHVIAE